MDRDHNFFSHLFDHVEHGSITVDQAAAHVSVPENHQYMRVKRVADAVEANIMGHRGATVVGDVDIYRDDPHETQQYGHWLGANGWRCNNHVRVRWHNYDRPAGM